MRGYDIVNNKRYGPLPHEKHLHDASTKPRMTPWEKIELGKSARPENFPHADWLSGGAYLESLAPCYYGDGKPRGTNRANSAASTAPSAAARRPLAASASAPVLGASASA